MIRVLLADDQTLVRGAFALLVNSADDMEVVGEAGTGDEAVTLTRDLRPDVVLMDIRMPSTDGIEATRQICADDASSKVLILTTFETDTNVLRGLRAGACGFLPKDTRPDALLDAIRTVAAGEALLSPGATRAVITRALSRPDAPPPERLASLTAREREVLRLVAAGRSNQEIADDLVVSPLTAKTHVARILAKLGARDRVHLVIAAYEAGLL
ncbi:two component transcriptional regulator, LuxR family [Kribbella flavida DSM 17836]|uniref:Two component transcriptional regulator, LuxR family n=1 Tax=Kribbella flavida (strain DSM 17836 / JCM 10339 / NBRC 14399) TaxID=479435 RepID=D2PQ64_KRIFD|nr:response regulator transcription factor [Kribbella flavida]ADB34766.1 two component transcriptional regulator, LuxR family [Kribbella flavida DSM 17836]